VNRPHGKDSQERRDAPGNGTERSRCGTITDEKVGVGGGLRCYPYFKESRHRYVLIDASKGACSSLFTTANVIPRVPQAQDETRILTMRVIG